MTVVRRIIARSCFLGCWIGLSLGALSAHASQEEFRLAQQYYQQKDFLQAARYAFSAIEDEPALQPRAHALISLSLMRAGMYQSASYFFIRTLQSGDKQAIRQVLTRTDSLLVRVGGDLLRPYLIRYTQFSDYDSIDRSAYLYSLGKQALLKGQESRAIQYLSGVSGHSTLWPYALQLRGSAHAILGQAKEAQVDFRACIDKAQNYARLTEDEEAEEGSARERLLRARHNEAEDLAARCQAGEARILYQSGQFSDADRTYDEIPKASLVWPDILFEQAWNAFARQEYNRALGRLVTYKSPALGFVFNSEVDVLRAQSFLMLCLYDDANNVINEFNAKYARVTQEVKSFVDGNANNLAAFYQAGAIALKAPISAPNPFNRVLNRFVRGPYFQNLVAAQRALSAELARLRQIPSTEGRKQGLPGFLEHVLSWRLKSIRSIGGAFVKNSLIDHHQALLSDFDKMAFIKLEMLGRAKDQLLGRKSPGGDRMRGNREPSRRDDQYYWSFNGEFWNDEIGDYVFGLESECGGGKG